MNSRTKPDHTREELEEIYSQVWDTDEVMKDFDVTGFLSPVCFATRRTDGIKGMLRFQHNPRFYFDFSEGRP